MECQKPGNCYTQFHTKMILKNRALLIICFVLYSTNLFSQEKTIFEFEKDKKLNIELNKKVKSVNIQNENLKNDYSEIYIYEFNEDGVPLKIISFGLGIDVRKKELRDEEVHYEFQNGKLISKLNKATDGLDGDIFEYDNNWNLILEKNYMFNTLVKEISREYDSNNRIISKTEFLYGGFSDYNEETQEGKNSYLYDKVEYKYDKNNNLISKTTTNYRKNIIEERVYKFDTSNNLIEEGECFKSNGKADCIYKPLFGFQYDEKNRLTKKFQLAKFSPHNTDTYYKFDENGNEIESIGYYIYPNKEPVIGYQFKYEYNEFGNKIKDTEVIGKYRSLNFEKYKTEITEYDNFQNVTSEKFLTESETPIKIIEKKYEYDDYGNWTKRITEEGRNYDDLKPIEISTRNIEYY